MMLEYNEYKFNILNDTSVSEDLFEDQTHINIANTLFDIIDNKQSDGITIGLEGSWGAGKSSIITMLENRLKKSNYCYYCYFDAWAHEGDPLRRIFLETLIDQTSSINNNLNQLKDTITSKTKTTKTTTNQTVTNLGKFIALSTLFVPVGASIVSDTASHVSFDANEQINILFIIGILLSVLPVFVLMCHVYILRKAGKDIYDSFNWPFLQGESTNEVTQEVSEDNEKSSIEFEKYFIQVIDGLLSADTNSKLIIVIDNLDRVNSDDSLKLWSTLQTFLQFRSAKNSINTLLNKIWIIVPYDDDGLSRLWDKKTQLDVIDDVDTAKHNSEYSECAKSFIDKCFQLRIEVPKLLITGWENFVINVMESALIGWTSDDKKDIINVIKLTRDSVNDIPTPRQIKNYINQVGILRIHCDPNITIKAISYYCIYKYMKQYTTSKLEYMIINHDLPYNHHIQSLPNNINAELTGILFGVNPDKGQQILLEPKIENALKTKDTNLITKLAIDHKSAFWTVFNMHLPQINDRTKILKYTYTVMYGLYEQYKSECHEYVKCIVSKEEIINDMGFPSSDYSEEYVATLKMLCSNKYNTKVLWKNALDDLASYINKSDADHDYLNKVLDKMNQCFVVNHPSKSVLSGISLVNWARWSIACYESELTTYNIVGPPKDIVIEVYNNIKPSSPMLDGLCHLIQYLVDDGGYDMTNIMTSLDGYTKWNNGAPHSNILTIDIVHTLLHISKNTKFNKALLAPIVKSPQFYNLIYHTQSEKSVMSASIIMLNVIADEIETLQIPAVGNSIQGYELCRQYWTSTKAEDVNYVWHELSTIPNIYNLWILAKNEKNKLIGEIIKLAITDNSVNLFKIQQPLDNMCYAIDITGNSVNISKQIATKFIECSSIKQYIVDNTINLDDYSRELYYLLLVCDDVSLVKYISDKVEATNKEIWDVSFKEDTYLTSLAIKLHDKGIDIKLDNAYCDSLISFTQDLLSGRQKLSEWQEDNINHMLSLVKGSFKTHFKKEIAKYILINSFLVEPNILKLIIDFVNVKHIIVSNKDRLQELITKGVIENNKQILNVIDILICNKKQQTVKLDTYLTDILIQPITEIINNENDDDTINIITNLAAILNIDVNSDTTNSQSQTL